MEILEKAPDRYIQQCNHCMAILKYSDSDIHPAWTSFRAEDGTEWTGSNDFFICPSCNKAVVAERTWFTGIEWIKKLLDGMK